MRILLLAHAPSVHTALWARSLQARGHEVRLLSAETGGATPPVPTRRIGRALPARVLRYASARGEVRDEIRTFRPDVTVAHFLPNYGFLAALAGARPWMLVCWGSDLLINAERTPLHRLRARWTLRHAGLIHVDAEVLGVAAVRLGADPARVWVRPWGVDTAAIRPAARWVERRDGGPIRILWTRQLEELYDPETFVRGLRLLAERGVELEATIAGSGPLRPGLERLLRRSGLDGRARLTGWLDRERLLALYRSHHVYVSLSRSDSTSQSLLEAMAAGLVPVVTDIPGNREWVTHRREGLLVPVGDEEALAAALGEIAGEPDRAGDLAERARTAVERRARLADTLQGIEERLRALAARP